ncbi:MAG TPA: tetratricopeptide repeat protein [Vicinamibacteria bacterium]
MGPVSRGYRALFGSGMAVFGISLAVGTVQACRRDGHLPSLVFHNHLRVAVERASRGDLRLAQSEYRSAADIDPTDFVAVDGYARTLTEQGDLAGALQALVRARSARPLDPRLHEAVGLTLLGLHRPAEAVESLRLAVKMAPRRPLARVGLGDALRAAGRLGEAEAAYREALQQAPRDAAIVNKLGITLALQGRADQARAAFQQALLLEPGFAEAATNLQRLQPAAVLRP